jgi:dipeptidyl aminopeptidase/acylaminoacyl peptidase
MAESEQFFRALLDAGCESDLVILHDCNHLGDAMGPVPARIGQNEALLGWFERWLKSSVRDSRESGRAPLAAIA